MRKKSPFKNRDLVKDLLFPTMSWSSVSQWEYDKEKWYKQYVLGIAAPMNETMLAGNTIGQKLVSNKRFLPKVPRPEIYEHSVKDKLGKISLIGHMDGWSPSVCELLEYKTSTNSERWDQEKVNKWGQITFYCLLLWLSEKVRPERLHIRLVAIPTEEYGSFQVRLSKTGKIKVFETTRTFTDIMMFGAYLKRTHKDMQRYVDNHA